MARFSDLPRELVHDIMYRVQPDDIDNLVLTSRHLYLMSSPVLAEHRNLRRQYTVISHSAKVPQGKAKDLSPVHQLPRLLKAIIEYPRIGYYIKKIVVKGLEENWMTDSEFNYQYTGGEMILNPRCPEDDIELFKQTASQFQILNPEDVETPDVEHWRLDFDHGNNAVVLGLIMLHCPNLLTFDFEDRGGPTREIFDLLENNYEDERCNILSRLKYVRFDHSEWGNGSCNEDINRLKRLLALPAIESIEAYHLDSIQDDEVGAPMPYRGSNIQSLKFIHGDIPNKSFFELLEATRQLKSLTLHHTSLNNYWIRAALMAFAKDSLEYLSLHSDIQRVGEDLYMGPLKPFSVLKTIVLDDVMLENPKYGEIQDLEAHLPASLQSLSLDLGEGFLGGLDNELELMFNVNVNGKAFPHLRKVTLTEFHEAADDYSEFLKKVREGFASQGVEFNVETQRTS